MRHDLPQLDHMLAAFAHYEMGYLNMTENPETARVHLTAAKNYSDKKPSYSMENMLLSKIAVQMDRLPPEPKQGPLGLW